VEAVATLFTRLIESLPALLIILAVAFLALGLAGGVTYHDILPMQDTMPRILAGRASIVLIGLAIYLSRTAASIALPKKGGLRHHYQQPARGQPYWYRKCRGHN
jgi:hypothetical protein